MKMEASTLYNSNQASMFVEKELRNQVASLYIRCVNKETHIVPLNPVSIFTEDELNSIPNTRQRIFYSYFSHRDIRLRVKINFDPDSEFDYLLIGIYYKKNGMDEELSALLDRRPELFIFTLGNFFIALFAPHLEHTDFGSICFRPEDENFPLCVILDDKLYDCLTLADRLHNSPLLKDITFHMTTHHQDFRLEIARRGGEGSEYEEMVSMVSDTDEDRELAEDRKKMPMAPNREDIEIVE